MLTATAADDENIHFSILSHCCPVISLSLWERVGVREFKKANALIIFSLIPAFSLREKVQEPFATPSCGRGDLGSTAFLNFVGREKVVVPR